MNHATITQSLLSLDLATNPATNAAPTQKRIPKPRNRGLQPVIGGPCQLCQRRMLRITHQHTSFQLLSCCPLRSLTIEERTGLLFQMRWEKTTSCARAFKFLFGDIYVEERIQTLQYGLNRHRLLLRRPRPLSSFPFGLLSTAQDMQLNATKL